MRLTSVLFLGALFAAHLPAATLYTITFDAGDAIGGLPTGAVLGMQYTAGTGATFSPNAFSGPGGPTGTWATNTNMTIVSSTGGDVASLGSPSLVSGNMLRSWNGWLNENGDPSFRITFAGAGISSISMDFAGIASSFVAGNRIFAYNGATLLTTVTAGPTTGQLTLTVSGVGPITSVAVTPGQFNDWVGIDNIRFTTFDGAEIPEPATWSLVGGALIAGILLRRRS